MDVVNDSVKEFEERTTVTRLICEITKYDKQIEKLTKIVDDLKAELKLITSSIKHLESDFNKEKKEFDQLINPTFTAKLYTSFVSGKTDVEVEFQQVLDAQHIYEKEFDEMLKLKDEFYKYSKELRKLQNSKIRESQIKELEYKYALEQDDEKTKRLVEIRDNIASEIKFIRRVRFPLNRATKAENALEQCIVKLKVAGSADNPRDQDFAGVMEIIEHVKVSLRNFLAEFSRFESNESKKEEANDFRALANTVFNNAGISELLIDFGTNRVENIKNEFCLLHQYLEKLEKTSLDNLYSMINKAQDIIDT